MTAWLYRFRGELIALWCLGVALLSWPARGGFLSLVPLSAGLALRVWARRHAGAHTRGREMSAPYRAVGGPYRFLPHPLYAANLLVLTGLAWRLLGDRPLLIGLSLCGPVVLYAVLARAESRLLTQQAAVATNRPLDARAGRWTSEWASLAPPVLAWVLAGW